MTPPADPKAELVAKIPELRALVEAQQTLLDRALTALPALIRGRVFVEQAYRQTHDMHNALPAILDEIDSLQAALTAERAAHAEVLYPAAALGEMTERGVVWNLSPVEGSKLYASRQQLYFKGPKA